MAEEITAREKIVNAYFDYLKIKDYNRIKVSEIISAAYVNRSTFYRNFEDVYSLYKTICDELKAEITAEIHALFDPADIRKSATHATEKVLENETTGRFYVLPAVYSLFLLSFKIRSIIHICYLFF